MPKEYRAKSLEVVLAGVPLEGNALPAMSLVTEGEPLTWAMTAIHKWCQRHRRTLRKDVSFVITQWGHETVSVLVTFGPTKPIGAGHAYRNPGDEWSLQKGIELAAVRAYKEALSLSTRRNERHALNRGPRITSLALARAIST